MNAYLRFDGVELWQLAGWTMLHFLWLGTLVGLIAGVIRLLLRRMSPNIRYITATATLAVLASMPLAIAAWLFTAYPTDFLADATRQARGLAVDLDEQPVPLSLATEQAAAQIVELSGRNETTPETAPSAPGLLRLPSSPEPTAAISPTPPAGLPMEHVPSTAHAALPASAAYTSWYALLVEPLQSCALYLPWIWLIGTPIMFALLASGIVGTRRLRLASRPIHDGSIAELHTRLATSLRIGKRVGLAVCNRIATPVLIGIVRPIILLPPAALTGWAPDEIEMVLLHELAHVRRWDNLINLAQRIIESLLFFHPVVWLVSNWIRREREACCDALVVDRTKRPHAYAELLVALAAELPRSVLFQPAASSAMASGPLRNRIRRILQLEDDPMLVSGKSLAFVFGSLLIVAILAVLYAPSIGQAEDSTAKQKDFTTEGTESTEKSDIKSGEPQGGELTTLSRDEGVSDVGRGSAEPRPHSTEQSIAGESRPSEKNEPIIPPYKITRDLLDDVEKWAVLMKVRTHLEDNGEFIMQAPPAAHERLQALLKSTPKWNEPTKAAERSQNPVVMSVENGKSLVEWRTLGLSLGPQRRVERSQFLPREVVGLEVVAVEPGSPADWLTIRPNDTLVKISNFDTANLSEFASMIRSLLDGSTRTDHTITIVKSDGEQIHTYFQIRKRAPPQPRPTQPGNNSELPGVKTATFPPLEDQKLADLAYKRLQLELESIGEEELRRVRALGFEGGLRITSAPSGMVPGGILVGLHAWPIRNLNDVAAVLNREDLAELTPLKYYIVQPEGHGGPFGGAAEGRKDVVVTGRIPVQLTNAPRLKFPWESDSAADRASANQPADGKRSDANDSALSGPPAEPSSDSAAEIPRYVLPAAAEEDQLPKWPNQKLPGITAAPDRKQTPRSAKAANPAAPEVAVEVEAIPQDGERVLVVRGPADAVRELTSDKENLRYEGKTFEEWRDASQIELSTERQLSAVQALAAFGANGYAREATEAILDVAAKHDFGAPSSRDSAESRLKSAIYNSFTSRRSIGKSIAFPMIFQRYERAPETWHDFVVYVLSRPPNLPSEVIATVRPLLEHDQPEMRAAALEAIYQSVPAERTELLNSALRDPDPNVVETGLQLVDANESRISNGDGSDIVDFPIDAFLDLLFRSDPNSPHESRDRAREMLTGNDVSPQSIDQILVRLTAVLNDGSKQDEHLKVIRAMRQIARGPRTAKHNTILASHKSALDRAFSESKDMQLRAAAAWALYDFVGSTQRRNQLQKEAQDLPRDAREKMQQLIAAEEEAEW